jgi:hypothetical protein
MFGTPPDHATEKNEHKVVTAPEFDVTQYAKKLALVLGVLAPALAGVLKALKIEHVSSGMVIGAFGVTAAALLGVSVVMAVDIAARAYLTVGEAGKEEAAKDAGSKVELVGVEPGTVVWLKDDDEPHPVLAIASDGASSNSYLVAAGPTIERQRGNQETHAVDGAPEWHSSDKIRAIRPNKWP